MEMSTDADSIKPPPTPPRPQARVFAPLPTSKPSNLLLLPRDDRLASESSQIPSHVPSSRPPSKPHLSHLLSKKLSSCGLNEEACYEYYLASPAFNSLLGTLK